MNSYPKCECDDATLIEPMDFCEHLALRKPDGSDYPRFIQQCACEAFAKMTGATMCHSCHYALDDFTDQIIAICASMTEVYDEAYNEGKGDAEAAAPVAPAPKPKKPTAPKKPSVKKHTMPEYVLPDDPTPLYPWKLPHTSRKDTDLAAKLVNGELVYRRRADGTIDLCRAYVFDDRIEYHHQATADAERQCVLSASAFSNLCLYNTRLALGGKGSAGGTTQPSENGKVRCYVLRDGSPVYLKDL